MEKSLIIKSAPIAEVVRAFNISNSASLSQQQDNYKGRVQSYTPDKGLYASPLGTPVMQDLTFGAAIYIDRATRQPRRTRPITFINFLLRVSQSKKIVKTEIQGMRGTVKEYIGEDDWQITINGLLVGENGKNPTEDTVALKNILTVNALTPFSIPVVCSYLNNLDIFNIVVENFDMEQDPGGYSKQRFTINAISEADFLLQVF
jgi:hypothetical protein